MKEQLVKTKITKDYVERLRSLLQDGYRCRFTSENDNFYMASLKHMANGNSITLRADFREYYLQQTTNKIVTFRQDYQP